MITLEENKRLIKAYSWHINWKADMHHHSISTAPQRILLTKSAQSEHLLFK